MGSNRGARWVRRLPALLGRGALEPVEQPTSVAGPSSSGHDPIVPLPGRTFSDQVIERLRDEPGAPTDPAAFLRWLNESDPDQPPGLSRYLFAMWRLRADLNDTFPGVHWNPDARLRLQLWAHHFLATDAGAPPELVPEAPSGVTDIADRAVVGPPPPLAAGVAIVGFLRATLGLGDAARRLVRLVEMAGERVRSLPYDHTNSPLGISWPDADPLDTDALDVVIIAVNGSEAPRVRRALGASSTHGRYVIGLWFWELAELPDDMASGFAAVDEVWVTSEFTAQAVRARAPVTVAVRVIPLGADCPPNHVRRRSAADRTRFGLPLEAVVVGTMFDYWSRIERKNPLALLESWKLAFPHPEPERRVLFVKSLNGRQSDGQRQLVEQAADGRSDIVLFDAILSAADRDLLADQFDVFASLHRAEGYGLTLLDAMHRGIPVIATNYSGNLAFMTEDNSWLLPFEMEEIMEDAGSYRAGQSWAQVDINAAAGVIKEVIDGINQSLVQRRVKQAQLDVSPLIDGRLGTEFIRTRLAEIRKTRLTKN